MNSMTLFEKEAEVRRRDRLNVFKGNSEKSSQLCRHFVKMSLKVEIHKEK